MPMFRIECAGLTRQEAAEFAELLNAIDGTGSISIDHRFKFSVGRIIFGALFSLTPLQGFTVSTVPSADAALLSSQNWTIIIHLARKGAEAAGTGTLIAAGNHLYKKVGEGIVDTSLAWLKAKVSRKTSSNVEMLLYGPDNRLIRKIKGRR